LRRDDAITRHGRSTWCSITASLKTRKGSLDPDEKAHRQKLKQASNSARARGPDGHLGHDPSRELSR